MTLVAKEVLHLGRAPIDVCCNLTKGYWIKKNNQDGGWIWKGNLHNINEIQYLPIFWRSKPQLVVYYIISILTYLSPASPNEQEWHKNFLRRVRAQSRSLDTTCGFKTTLGLISIPQKGAPHAPDNKPSPSEEV